MLREMRHEAIGLGLFAAHNHHGQIQRVESRRKTPRTRAVVVVGGNSEDGQTEPEKSPTDRSDRLSSRVSLAILFYLTHVAFSVHMLYM